MHTRFPVEGRIPVQVPYTRSRVRFNTCRRQGKQGASSRSLFETGRYISLLRVCAITTLILLMGCGGAMTGSDPTQGPTHAPDDAMETPPPAPSPTAVPTVTPIPATTRIAATPAGKTASYYRERVEEHLQVLEEYDARTKEMIAAIEQGRNDPALCRKVPDWVQELKAMLAYLDEARPDFEVGMLTAVETLDGVRDGLQEFRDALVRIEGTCETEAETAFARSVDDFTCGDLEGRIIKLSGENKNPFAREILKLYDIKEVSRTPTRLECTADAKWNRGDNGPVYFHIEEDEDGDLFFGYRGE